MSSDCKRCETDRDERYWREHNTNDDFVYGSPYNLFACPAPRHTHWLNYRSIEWAVASFNMELSAETDHSVLISTIFGRSSLELIQNVALMAVLGNDCSGLRPQDGATILTRRWTPNYLHGASPSRSFAPANHSRISFDCSWLSPIRSIPPWPSPHRVTTSSRLALDNPRLAPVPPTPLRNRHGIKPSITYPASNSSLQLPFRPPHLNQNPIQQLKTRSWASFPFSARIPHF